jgi:hypothetical protein
MRGKQSNVSIDTILDAYATLRSWRRVSSKLKLPRATLYNILKRHPDRVKEATDCSFQTIKVARPKRGVKRYIYTSAQNEAPVDTRFWKNLSVFAQHCGAELGVIGYSYNPCVGNTANRHFAEEIAPYIISGRIDIANKLLVCAEINISPTAVQPLSGFETYTREKWGVFGHPRVALQSVPTGFDQKTKQIMTTGCVTLPNYIYSKAGMKAEFHHVIGALLVEVDDDGDVFCRHLIADADGNFQDLNTIVKDGRVLASAYRVAAITWGDIHVEQLDPLVDKGCFSAKGMLDVLDPEYQFFHDIIDFTARNSHNADDPHHRFKMWVSETERVDKVFERARKFLARTRRPSTTGYVVESNHDYQLMRWLKRGDYKNDPANSQFFLQCQSAVYAALARKDNEFSIFAWALASPDAEFIPETKSFKIFNDKGRGIECALHGHKGANGAKGQLYTFAKMGSKANVGHTHSAAIYEGIYQAGTSSKLDLEYNRGGLSSWNHAHIVTYLNGKRTIITMCGEKWRAR